MDPLHEHLWMRLKEAMAKTGVDSVGRLAKFIPDENGFALNHMVFRMRIDEDPVRICKLIHDEILIPESVKSYPQKPYSSKKRG
jgi:hypothetical protein